jgi:hypothetical protein
MSYRDISLAEDSEVIENNIADQKEMAPLRQKAAHGTAADMVVPLAEEPLVHPKNVICSENLKANVSFYSQFELAPTFKEVCGERMINGSFREQFIRS